MKPIKQTITGNRFANCFQAAVASLLEMELNIVPNFMLFKDRYWDAIVIWFISQGYDIAYVDGLPPNDDKYYIVSEDFGDEFDYSHSVIMKNGEVVHDPSLNSGIKGNIIGYYWISSRSAV